MAEIVTLGEAMALLVGADDASLRRVPTFHRSVAGAESNVAVAMSRLGHRVRWIGRVGADPLGDGVLATLRAEGVDLSHVIVDGDAPTGILVRDRHPARPIQVVYHRAGSAGSRLQPEDLRADQLRDARLLHVSGVTAALSPSASAATLRACELARAAGVPVSFDPNLRTKLWSVEEAIPVLSELARRATVVLAGVGETALLAGSDRPKDLEAWYLERGAELVVLKDGAHGSWATNGRERWEQPALSARPVDPVGAGDAFAAAFLSRRLDGGSPPRCLAAGAAAGAMAIEAVGDIEGLPFADELEARLAGESEVCR